MLVKCTNILIVFRRCWYGFVRFCKCSYVLVLFRVLFVNVGKCSCCFVIVHNVLYFSYLFQDSLQKQNELKEVLNILPETREEDILHNKSQLEYLEAIFTLQLSIAGDHEVES